ncbi:MAG: CARDB domain-containing protein [Pleurocapsa sp. MO_192.B19]|nr:CARDB domain-containing protein [Pleurocapsa sp. MO_192.B19]
MISLNTITKDTLNSESEKHPIREGNFKNDYLLTDIVVGESVKLSLVSDQFDTYLELIDQETGEIIAENDDIGSLLNSELNFTPEAGINYLVRVTSYDSQETGDYTLIVGKPDLDIDLDITSFIAPSTGVLGETIEVSWIVKNQGTDATIVNWYDSVYISDDEIVDDSDLLFAYVENGGEDFTSLAGGESISSSFNLRLLNDAEPGDNRYLLLVADTESVLPETDKTNNTLAVPIALTAPDIDLTISNVSVPTELIANETVDASWTVTNEGTDTTNSEWYDYVYLSDDEILDNSDTYINGLWTQNRESTPLDNGESYTVTNSFDLPDAEPGDEPDGMASQRYLLFVANRWNYQYETNQENNTVAIPIVISPPDVDLTITTDLEALTGESGDRISLNWTVANQGTQSTNVNSWSDLVYLSPDQTIDDSDIYLGGFAANSNIGGVPLAAGENYDRSFFPILPDAESGQYYLLFNANGDSSQAETNEDNNIVAVPLTLGIM